MKRLLSLILPLILIVTLLCSCYSREKTVTIYYTTDMHGRVISDEDAIGLDVITSLYKSTPDSLLVDAGDFLHGSPTATLTEGADIISLMKKSGYFAAAVGNHEFSFGKQTLINCLSEAKTGSKLNILSANIQNSNGDPFIDGTAITNVAGLKVGMFGLTTLDTALQSASDAVEGLNFTDPIEAAKQSVEKLKSEKCDIIIALTHLGSDPKTTVKSADIANNVDGIDAIIDGHSHVLLDDKINDIPVVSAGKYGQAVGKLTLKYFDGKIIQFDNTLLDKLDLSDIKPNSNVNAYINQISKAQESILSEVVGHTEVKLEGEKQVIRTRETNLGNLTADALVSATGADIGLMNAGCIRATIPNGDITKSMVIEAFSYSNIVVVKEVTGAEILDILEHACGKLPEADGRYAQISGIQFDLNIASDNRVSNLCLTDGTKIDKKEVYTLATNDFIASGGDDYPHLADLPILRQGKTVEEVFLDFLSHADFERYQPEENSRIWSEHKIIPAA